LIAINGRARAAALRSTPSEQVIDRIKALLHRLAEAMGTRAEAHDGAGVETAGGPASADSD
jgi:hypothetical protein